MPTPSTPRDAVKRSPGTRTTGARGRAARGTSQRERDRRAKPPRAPIPIVVVTADPSLARMLSFALDQMRLPYRLITSGSRALADLLAMPVGPQAPIVVLDVDLPGMDGHAILERLGVDRPNTFLILVLSGHADESVQVRSLLAGALDHVAKPFNVRVLMAKIQRLAAMAAHLAGAA
jgi:DNA-binding response OmpR family regulator